MSEANQTGIFQANTRSYCPYRNIINDKVQHMANVHNPSGQDKTNK